MTAADKPRADLVALLCLFEAAARTETRRQSLALSGNEEGAAVRAWAELRGHRVQEEQRTRVAFDGRTLAYTGLTVEEPGAWASWTVTCSLHDDREVDAMVPQADQQVLARVQAALDGEPAPCPECDGPADHCADCGVPDGRPHEAFCHQQPEAAEGSV